nr:MAG TPA: hypothetical protein [Caudoviricetes sp.]
MTRIIITNAKLSIIMGCVEGFLCKFKCYKTMRLCIFSVLLLN